MPAALRRADTWAVLAIVAGAALRVQQWWVDRSLWLDEASLVHNLAGRDYAGLAEPLEFLQSAPLGFLWAERAAIDLAGPSERALRFVPLVAGVAALVLVWRAGRRLLAPWAATLAVALLALSPAAVRYATEVKQYGVDMLATAVLVWAGARLLADDARVRDALILGVAAALAVWVSHPAVLVAAAVTAVAAGRALWRRNAGLAGAVVAAGAAGAVSFAGTWAVSLSRLATRDEFEAGWAENLAPEPFSVGGWLEWLPGTLADLGRNPLDAGPLAVPAVVVIALGIGLLVWRRPWSGALLAAVVVTAVVAATLRLYPLGARVAVYLLPVAALGAAGVLDAALGRGATADEGGRPPIGRHGARSESATTGQPGAGGPGAATPGWRRAAAAAATVVVLGAFAPMWLAGARLAAEPLRLVELGPVLAAVGAEMAPGDVVAVHDVALSPFAWYAPRHGVPGDLTLVVPPPGCDASIVGALPDADRLWVVFAYTASSAPPGQRSTAVAILDERYERVETILDTDAAAYAWDLRRPGTGMAGGSAEVPCVGFEPFPGRWVAAMERPEFGVSPPRLPVPVP